MQVVHGMTEESKLSVVAKGASDAQSIGSSDNDNGTHDRDTWFNLTLFYEAEGRIQNSFPARTTMLH